MKQTAVEWLVNQVEDFIGLIPVDIIEQAKAMEKEQIMDAFDIRKVDIAFDKKTTSEQYYKENYETS
jgi:hypothetical protein